MCVRAPCQKWLIAKEACSEALAKAVAEWEVLEAAVLKKMVTVGFPEWEAKRVRV